MEHLIKGLVSYISHLKRNIILGINEIKKDLFKNCCKTELFLAEESFEQKIKLQVTYAAGIIPVVQTIIESVIKFGG